MVLYLEVYEHLSASTRLIYVSLPVHKWFTVCYLGFSMATAHAQVLTLTNCIGFVYALCLPKIMKKKGLSFREVAINVHSQVIWAICPIHFLMKQRKFAMQFLTTRAFQSGNLCMKAIIFSKQILSTCSLTWQVQQTEMSKKYRQDRSVTARIFYRKNILSSVFL